MNYRPHVDGLRAVAVLFVLIFHAGLNLFPSGFIGVDIFFVISGFLITGIIHTSLQNNDFSFIRFYKRRLWRLQPVFVCLIIVTTLFTFLFYIPEDLLEFAKSARKTTLFLSNQYFERATNGYFAENTNHLPLLHTWSLSIEWQCYLILPLLFYLLHLFFGERNINKIVYLLTLVFFALALYFSAVIPAKSYYLFSSRIFEFLIGSCLVLTPKRFTLNAYLLNILSLFALLTLFYIASLKGISLGFPNLYALFICLATAFLIKAGDQESTPFSIKLLSLQPIVFIGLLSYSLYIWHWPIFVLIRYLSIEESTLVLIIAFSLVTILAYLSWRFIEKPSRQRSHFKFSTTLVGLFFLPALIFHLNAYGITKFAGFPQRHPSSMRIFSLLQKYSSTHRNDCIYYDSSFQKNDCRLGSLKETSRKGLLIGDSFANHSWQFIDLLAKDAKLSILADSTASCLSLPGILQFDWGNLRSKEIYHFCRDQTQRYFQMIKDNNYDYVILGEAWPDYISDKIVNSLEDRRSYELSKERIARALDQALQLITASGAKPVILKATAIPAANLRDCFFKHIIRRVNYKPELCEFSYDPNQAKWFDELFEQMKKKYTSLIIIDPKKVQCSQGKCSADINGVPVFRDQVHLTDYASYFMGKIYLKRFNNPFSA